MVAQQTVERFSSGTRLVRVKGKPYDMGKQRGEQIAGIIRDSVGRILDGQSQAGVPMARILEEAERYEDAINKKFPEVIDELRGMSDGAKIPYEDLRAAALGINTGDRKSYAKISESNYNRQFVGGCTSFAAAGPATSDGLPIAAKNADLAFPCGCLLIAEPSGGNRYMGHAMPWMPGVQDGLNEKGLAFAGAGITPCSKDAFDGYEKRKAVGVPVHFIPTFIFERCDEVDDALEYLKINPVGYAGRNAQVIDKDGNIVKAEISYEHVHLIYPEKHYAGSTNHFVSKEMSKYAQSRNEHLNSYYRYDRLTALLTNNVGKIDFDFAKSVMSDHKNGPSNYSICCHGAMVTGASYIMQPTAKRLWALLGHPCKGVYEPFIVGG